jgi:hypothetical protein
MLVTLMVIAALLAGATVLVSLQVASNKSTDLTRSGMSALFCAEAGLAVARPYVATNYKEWNASVAATAGGTYTEPAWLSSAIGSHDLDGDGVSDFSIYLKDNDDEQSPLANDLTYDNDLRVFIVSQCSKYPDTPKAVSELVEYNGATGCYPWQIGGCGGDGNNSTQ